MRPRQSVKSSGARIVSFSSIGQFERSRGRHLISNVETIRISVFYDTKMHTNVFKKIEKAFNKNKGLRNFRSLFFDCQNIIILIGPLHNLIFSGIMNMRNNFNNIEGYYFYGHFMPFFMQPIFKDFVKNANSI